MSDFAEVCEDLTIDDISNCLQTSTTYRPFVDVHFPCLPVDEIEKEVASKVERSVDRGGNQGKGYGRYGSVDYSMVI